MSGGDAPRPARRVLCLRGLLTALAIGHALWRGGWWWAGAVLLAADHLAWLMTWPERLSGAGAFRAAATPGRYYELVPGACVRFFFGSRLLTGSFRTVSAQVNSGGYRNPEPTGEDAGGARRVLVLGDSMTFGEGVPDGAEFVRLVEGRLRSAGHDLTLFNAGVGGYNTSQEVATLRELQPQVRPELVWMFLTLEDTLAWGAVQVDEQGRLFRPGAPLRHRVRDLAKRGSGLLWWLHEAYRFHRLDSYGHRLFREDIPGYQQWRGSMREFAELLGDTRRGLVFLAPGLWKLDQYPWRELHARIHGELEALGLACVDLLEVFEGRDARELWCHPLDIHPNEAGHRLIAEFVATHPAVLAQLEPGGVLATTH